MSEILEYKDLVDLNSAEVPSDEKYCQVKARYFVMEMALRAAFTGPSGCSIGAELNWAQEWLLSHEREVDVEMYRAAVEQLLYTGKTLADTSFREYIESWAEDGDADSGPPWEF